MQEVIVGWQVYQLTRDPLALGLIGLVGAVPYMGCLLWAGHLTDRSEKRAMIVTAESGLLACGVVLAILGWLHPTMPWPIYLVIAGTGVSRSFLWPSSASYIDLTVPKAIYARAAGWNSTLWQVAAIIGPIMGGWIYAVSDAAQAYAVATLCVGLGVWCATRLRPCPPSPSHEEASGLVSFLGGIRYVFSHPVILPAISLDMFAVLFGGAVALLPIFAEHLQVGPIGLGVLRAAAFVGALLMALYQAHRPPFARTGRALLIAVGTFGICMILFALSDAFLVSAFLLAISGAADNVSVVTRASVIQAMTPNHLRGRVSSVNGFFISSSNEIGAFESGVAAKLLGTVPSVVLGGCATLVVVGIAAWRSPTLRQLRMRDAPVNSTLGSARVAIR